MALLCGQCTGTDCAPTSLIAELPHYRESVTTATTLAMEYLEFSVYLVLIVVSVWLGGNTGSTEG